MFKRIFYLVVAVAVAAGVGYGAALSANLFLSSKVTHEKPQVRLENTEKPIFENQQKLVYEIPELTDVESHKAIAYELYALACQNYNAALQASSFVKYRTETFGTADGFRHTIRNGGEYFQTEYCFVLATESVQAIMGLFAAESTMFAERRYMGVDMSEVMAEKVTEPRPTFSIDENKQIHYNAEWDLSRGKNSSYKLPPPNFEFLTDQNILVETMSFANVSYNAEEGYYILRMELDVNNAKTTEKTLPTLKESLNDTAYYTSMIEEFHIWDNGYPKYFRSVDTFTGEISILTMNARLDYETFYHYDDISCDYKNYQFMEEFKDKLLD